VKLVIATPSPFARNPWQTNFAANPLGKVPALLLDDARVVHDSSAIIEYLETLGAPPALIPAGPALRVAHR
jgi:glutathione S-transferase